MSRDELFVHFQEKFPNYAPNVLACRKTGSKMISMDMVDGTRLTFIYISPTNWSFGTRPWRRPPMKGIRAEMGKVNELKS